MTHYWVVGGEYQDTNFDQPVAGTAVRRFGPFDTHADARAKAEWQKRAWSTVDDALSRFRIEILNGSEHPPGA